MNSAVTSAPREPRPRDREKTKATLELARSRVRSKGLKMTISAVAAEARVTPGLIHNTYPEFAAEIRKEMGRGARQQRDAMAAELADARATIRELRKELRAAKADLAKLASINETLSDEVVRLEAQSAGKLTVLRTFSGR